MLIRRELPYTIYPFQNSLVIIYLFIYSLGIDGLGYIYNVSFPEYFSLNSDMHFILK